MFRNVVSFSGEKFLTPRPTPRWRSTPCRLSATVYSIRLQLISISGNRSSILRPLLLLPVLLLQTNKDTRQLKEMVRVFRLFIVLFKAQIHVAK
jgi:hypothetical protein